MTTSDLTSLRCATSPCATSGGLNPANSTVLIVDDQARNRRLLSALVQANGQDVLEAESGPEALQCVREHKVDAILLDMMMPGMDGHEVACRLKSDPNTSAIPIIMVTALHDREVRLQALQSGVEDFLTKPVDRHELKARLGNLLRLKSATDQLNADKQLLAGVVRQQGDEWQQLVENLPGVVLRLNRSGEVCYLSGPLTPMLSDSDLGRPLWELLSLREDGAVAQHRFQTVLHHREAQWFHARIDDPDTGDRRYFEFRLAAHQVAGQDPDSAGVVVFVADTTEERTLAEALMRSERRLRHLMSRAPITIYTCDAKASDLTHVGENVSDLVGFRPDAPTPLVSAWQKHIHQDDVEIFEQSFQELSRQGESRCEYRLRHADGHHIWIRDERRMDEDDQGQASQIIGTWHDVSRQKQLEEEVFQSQKMQAIGRLAGGIAHDFNNILTVIQGNSRFVLDDLSQDHESRGDVEEILGAAQRASALTRQLLSFSRKHVVKPVPTDLSDVVDAMSRMLSRLLGDDVTVDLNLADELPLVRIDVSQFEQIVMNLAVNARDAMPNGGQVRIETECDSAAYVSVRVSDNGTGMNAETLQHIFEPFFTTKPEGQGTGLGLATVFGIVEQAEGVIRVESQPGQGTTFHVRLPACPDRKAIVDTPEGPAVTKPSVDTSKTILVVDDEEIVLRIARQILHREGYLVLTADSGQAALRVAEEHPGDIDLLLTDVVMPEMSGRVLSEELKRRFPTIQIVFVSGYTDDDLVRSGVAADDVHLLHKPYRNEELLEAVQVSLAGRQMAVV